MFAIPTINVKAGNALVDWTNVDAAEQLFAEILDPHTGDVLASAGSMNPQIRFGEDLMSRVSYAMMNPGGDVEMTAAVRQAIDTLIAGIADEAKVATDAIYEIVFVCNPVMHHLFLGIDPTELEPVADGEPLWLPFSRLRRLTVLGPWTPLRPARRGLPKRLACSRAVYSAVQPPSSTSAEPVISDDASEARNTIAPVSSSSWPSRLRRESSSPSDTPCGFMSDS